MSESTPASPPARNEGWVYFIRGGQHIKIGWSPDPEKRLKALATGNAHPLTVLAKFPGSVRDEKLLHRLLKPYRVRADGEWFHARKPLLVLVDWARRHGATDEAKAADSRAREAGTALVRSEASIAWWKQFAEGWRAAAEEAREKLGEAEVVRGGYEVLQDAIEDAHKGVHLGGVAMLEAVAEMEAEVGRAIDATDDHDGLADAMREAVKRLRDQITEATGWLDEAHSALCQHSSGHEAPEE